MSKNVKAAPKSKNSASQIVKSASKKATISANSEPEIKGMRAKKNELDTMKTRTVPKVLCELISSMNATQIDVVVEMGFESLLHWDIKELPPRISY